MASSFNDALENCEECGTSTAEKALSYSVTICKKLCPRCARDNGYTNGIKRWVCPDHEEMDVEFYCHKCERGICQKCDHNNVKRLHAVISRDDAHAYFRTELQEKLQQLEIKKKDVEELEKTLEKCENGVNDCFNDVNTKMNDSAVEKKKIITEQLVAKTDAINEHYEQEVAKLEKERRQSLKNLAIKACGRIQMIDKKMHRSAEELEPQRTHKCDTIHKVKAVLKKTRHSCETVSEEIRSCLDSPETCQEKVLSTANCILEREHAQDVNTCRDQVLDCLPTDVELHNNTNEAYPLYPSRADFMILFVFFSFKAMPDIIQACNTILSTFHTEVPVCTFLFVTFFFFCNTTLYVSFLYMIKYDRETQTHVKIKYNISMWLRSVMIFNTIRMLLRGIFVLLTFNLVFIFCLLSSLETLTNIEIIKHNIEHLVPLTHTLVFLITLCIGKQFQSFITYFHEDFYLKLKWGI